MSNTPNEDLVRVTDGPDKSKELSFDAQKVFDRMKTLAEKAKRIPKASGDKDEDFLDTFQKFIGQVNTDVNDPRGRINALSRIRQINQAARLENDSHMEEMLRGLNSPTLDRLVKARLNGSLKAEMTAERAPIAPSPAIDTGKPQPQTTVAQKPEKGWYFSGLRNITDYASRRSQ